MADGRATTERSPQERTVAYDGSINTGVLYGFVQLEVPPCRTDAYLRQMGAQGIYGSRAHVAWHGMAWGQKKPACAGF